MIDFGYGTPSVTTATTVSYLFTMCKQENLVFVLHDRKSRKVTEWKEKAGLTAVPKSLKEALP